MIHKGEMICQVTVTEGNKFKTTLHSKAGSVSIVYEAVFADNLYKFVHIILMSTKHL
jgi:hypothetical protein